MFVTFKPEGEPEQRWEFDPDRVASSKAEMIEKRAGMKWDEWRQAIQMGSARARRALLWHLFTLKHHTLRFEDMPDFAVGDLVIEHSVAEVQALIAKISKVKMDDEQREQVQAAFDIELAEAYAREGLVEGEVVDADPKSTAVSKRSVRRTGSTSPTTSGSAPGSSTS